MRPRTIHPWWDRLRLVTGQVRIVQGTLRPKGRIVQGRMIPEKTYEDGSHEPLQLKIAKGTNQAVCL
jgi:hypothetical protein